MTKRTRTNPNEHEHEHEHERETHATPEPVGTSAKTRNESAVPRERETKTKNQNQTKLNQNQTARDSHHRSAHLGEDVVREGRDDLGLLLAPGRVGREARLVLLELVHPRPRRLLRSG